MVSHHAVDNQLSALVPYSLVFHEDGLSEDGFLTPPNSEYSIFAESDTDYLGSPMDISE